MPPIATLFAFFGGVGLCLWRAPYADRWHVVLTLTAAVVWRALPIFDPSTRTSGFAFIVTMLLTIALSQPVRRQRQSRSVDRSV